MVVLSSHAEEALSWLTYPRCLLGHWLCSDQGCFSATATNWILVAILHLAYSNHSLDSGDSAGAFVLWSVIPDLEKSVKDCKAFWDQYRKWIILVVFFFDLVAIELSLKIDYGLLSIELLTHVFEQYFPL